MTAPRLALVADRGTIVTGAALGGAAAWAWIAVVRGSSSMAMPGAGAPSLAECAAFTLAWGVMMAAMMLPSASPMILIYGTVARRLRSDGERVIPVSAFAAVYAIVWLLVGIPVYGGYVLVGMAAKQWPTVARGMPYAVAVLLVTTGIYQFTEAKRVCLRHCESPFSLLMRRWQSGYAATLRLALEHSAYCVGCCWGLMVILVAAGAMSLPWVLLIGIVVFVEKVIPGSRRTAAIVGVMTILLGVAVAAHPGLARTLRGAPGMTMDNTR